MAEPSIFWRTLPACGALRSFLAAADPMVPIECQRDIACAVPPHLLTYREFEGCGHGVVPDAPDEALALVRAFIRGQWQAAAVVGDAWPTNGPLAQQCC